MSLRLLPSEKREERDVAGVSSVPLLPLGVEDAVERVEGRLLCELDSLPPRDRCRRREMAAGFALVV